MSVILGRCDPQQLMYADSLTPFPACAIQTCLSRNSYNEAKCTSYVEALYKCCDAMYTQAERNGKGGETKSTACPVRDVVKRRMKSIGK